MPILNPQFFQKKFTELLKDYSITDKGVNDE